MSHNKRIQLAENFGYMCWWCHQKTREAYGWQNSATIEHMVPTCYGGANENWNLVSACARCNFVRGTTDCEEFAEIACHFTSDTRLTYEVRKTEKRKQARTAQQRQRARRRAEQAFHNTPWDQSQPQSLIDTMIFWLTHPSIVLLYMHRQTVRSR